MEQPHALVLVLLNFSWKLESLMGNSKVLGRLLSSRLLDKQVNCISVLRKVFHSVCLCRVVGWLCIVVNIWYLHKQLRSLRVLWVEPVQHFQWGSLPHRWSVGQNIDFLSLNLH